MPVSYDNNHHTTSASLSLSLHIYIYIWREREREREREKECVYLCVYMCVCMKKRAIEKGGERESYMSLCLSVPLKILFRPDFPMRTRLEQVNNNVYSDSLTKWILFYWSQLERRLNLFLFRLMDHFLSIFLFTDEANLSAFDQTFSLEKILCWFTMLGIKPVLYTENFKCHETEIFSIDCRNNFYDNS